MIEIKTKSDFLDSKNHSDDDISASIYDTLIEIKNEIRKNKDKALLYYTKKFDKVSLTNVIVSKDEIIQAKKQVSKTFIDAITVV